MRMLAGKAAENAVARLERRASRLMEVEPAARSIVWAVRQDGDKALRRYATLWDGLARGQSMRISATEIAEGWKATPAEAREALKRAAANIRRKLCYTPRIWLPGTRTRGLR